MDVVENILRNGEDRDIIGYTKTGAVVKEESINGFRGNGYFIYANSNSMGKRVSINNLRKIVTHKVNSRFWERHTREGY